MPGNSARKGAIRKAAKKPTAGSGGRVKRGLEGKGPTPKAKDRPNHKVYKQRAKSREGRRCQASDARAPVRTSEWVAGRNSVVEALRARIPVTAVYVAEGAERDGRLREAFRLAAEHGTSLLEISKGELDRLTGGAVHQGLAARIPTLRVRPPRRPARPGRRAGRAAADRGPRLGDRPAQPRRRGPQRRRLRGARRTHPGAPRGRHDRGRVEDQRRRRRPDPGRAGGQPGPAAQGLPGRRLHGDRPGRRR